MRHSVLYLQAVQSYKMIKHVAKYKTQKLPQQVNINYSNFTPAQ